MVGFIVAETNCRWRMTRTNRFADGVPLAGGGGGGATLFDHRCRRRRSDVGGATVEERFDAGSPVEE